jgi:probable phosphoglycerate mutase
VPAGATRLVLVRHGEAVCNVNGVVGGLRGCTGLTDRGVSQAGALRDRWARTGEVRGAALLYASTLRRAVQTAEIVAPALSGPTAAAGAPGIELRLDPDLCELRPGDADGLTWAEFSARFEEPDWDARPDQPIAPGGESWSGFVVRASEALRRIAARAAAGPDPDQGPRGPVVVVCHAGVIEASLLRFLPVDPAVPRLRLRTAHASLTEWQVADGAWTLERYNDGSAGG